MALFHVVHRAQSFFVAEAASPDIVADGLQIVIVEIDDAREMLGFPTSMALETVWREARGIKLPLRKNSGTTSFVLVAAMN